MMFKREPNATFSFIIEYICKQSAQNVTFSDRDITPGMILLLGVTLH